jgi:hypothetical protein
MGAEEEWCKSQKRPLGRPRRRRVDIKMDLREIGWGGMDLIDLPQDGVSCENCLHNCIENT